MPRAPRHARRTHPVRPASRQDRKSTRLNSSHVSNSYAVFCLKQKKVILCVPSSPKPTMLHPARVTTATDIEQPHGGIHLVSETLAPVIDRATQLHKQLPPFKQ